MYIIVLFLFSSPFVCRSRVFVYVYMCVCACSMRAKKKKIYNRKRDVTVGHTGRFAVVRTRAFPGRRGSNVVLRPPPISR